MHTVAAHGVAGFKTKATLADMLPDRTGGGDPVTCGEGTKLAGTKCVAEVCALTMCEHVYVRVVVAVACDLCAY